MASCEACFTAGFCASERKADAMIEATQAVLTPLHLTST
jgi:hypothetical protein